MQPTSITGQSRLRFLISSRKVLRTSKAPAALPQVAAPTMIYGLFCLNSRKCASARSLISWKTEAAERSVAFTFFFFLLPVLVPESQQYAVNSGRLHLSFRFPVNDGNRGFGAAPHARHDIQVELPVRRGFARIYL